MRPYELPFLDFVDLAEEFLLDVPTFREVPRRAQAQLGALTKGVCDALEEAGGATAEEERALKLLLLLHRLTLWAPRGAQARGRRGANGRAQRQAELVCDRIAAAWRGEWEELLDKARQRGAEAVGRRTGGRLQGEALAREVLRRTALREYSKAASLLGSPGMAAPTPAVEATLEQLLEKRPAPRRPPARGRGPGPGVSRKHLREALRRASKVAGPGPSGSRGVHWAVVLQAPAAFEAFARLADRIAAADLPEEVVDGLAAVCLHPLKKKPEGVRPVGAGESLRRVVGRALLAERKAALAEGVGKHQLGAGLRGGGEKLAHVVRATAEARPTDCWVALDLSNAFGTMLRDGALEAAAAVVPDCRPFLGMFLQRDTRYRFIRSTGEAVWMTTGEGAEQGDVWGPILYSLALAPCVAALEEDLRGQLRAAGWSEEAVIDAIGVSAYLDDLVIRVPPELAGQVVPAADRALQPMGGRLNPRKCHAWSPGTSEPAGLPAGFWQQEGLLLLGTPHGEGPSRGEDAPLPMGQPEVERHLQKTLASYRGFLAGLEQVVQDAPPKDPRVQTAVLLLRLCGQGKATHLLRTLPPALTKEFAEDLDAATEATLERFCRLEALAPNQRAQLRLPLRLGGLGLRGQADLRGVAYLGSWLGNLEGVRERCPPDTASQARFTSKDRAWTRALAEELTAVAAEGVHLTEQGEVVSEPPQASWAWEEDCAAVPKVQHALTKALEQKRREQLLPRLSPEDRAWVRSCGGQGAGAWLNTAPSSEVERFTDGDFCASVRTRLCQEVSPPGLRCSNTYANPPRAGERCAEELDTKGTHASTCKVGGGVGRKHDALVRLLARLLRAAGYSVDTDGPGTWEPRWDRPVLDRNGQQKRDEDGNPLWERARLDHRLEGGPEEPTTYGDVVVSQPRADSWVRLGAAADGAVASGAATRKHRRYPPDQVPGAKLVAFSVEAGGRWDEAALAFLRRAAGRASERHPGLAAMGGEGAGAVFSSWLSQLSCALQKANVACLRSAGAGGRGPAPGVHAEGAGLGEEASGPAEADDWLSDAVEQLLLEAAAGAEAELS